MNIRVIDRTKEAYDDMEALFRDCLEQAKRDGFDKAVVCLAKSDGTGHTSTSLTTNNVRTSEAVGILEICKSDVIFDARN